MPSVRSSVLSVAAFLVAGCAADSPKRGALKSSVTVPLLTYSTKSEEARQHVVAGERLSDTGYPIQAAEEFKRAVAADSSFGYAYLRVSDMSRTPTEALMNLSRALARMGSANPVERLLIQGDKAFSENDNRTGLAQTEQATVLEPRNARLWTVLGTQFSNAGNFTAARTALEKAASLDTTYALPLLGLADTYVASNPPDYPKAEAYVLKAQKLWPNESASYLALGRVHRAEGRMEDAVKAYSRAIELDPGSGDAYLVRGHANLFAGHIDAARADYAAAIRLAKPELRATNAIYPATMPAFQGNPDSALQALSDLRKAIDGLRVPDPTQDKANVDFAQAIIAMYNHRYEIADSAIANYAIHQAPANKDDNSAGLDRWYQGQVAFLKGTLAAFRGDLAAAHSQADLIERVRQQDNTVDKNYQLHGLRGVIALQEKQYALADKELQAADISSGIVTFLYDRALAMQGMGRLPEARQLMARAANNAFVSQENAAVHVQAVAALKALDAQH